MKKQMKINIIKEWCKGCEICVEVCPRDVLEMKDFVAKVKDISRCTGCMLCELLCPDFAIEVHNLKETEKTEK